MTKVYIVEGGSVSGPVYEGQIEGVFETRNGAKSFIRVCYDKYAQHQIDHRYALEPLTVYGDLFESGSARWHIAEWDVTPDNS